jgi:hypothetical protein
MRRSDVVLFFVILAAVAPALAQDVLTLGADLAPSGGAVTIPVSIRDTSSTPLGSDAGGSNGIRGFAFKVFFPAASVASVSFARAGVAAAVTPLYETTLQGSGWISYVASFDQALDFTLDAAAPGNRIGTLTVTLQSVAPGTIAALTFDPPAATLSNLAASVVETVANGNLSLANGSVTASAAIAAPSGLTATANGTSQVGLSWGAVGGADHYEVWRSSNGGAFASIGLPSIAGFTDSTVSANTTYLYRVQAIDAVGGVSAFSNTDAATTIVFQDDPAVAGSTTIEAAHVTELRSAVNAMRAAASLGPLAADATIGVGLTVRATHVSALRTGLDVARSAIGLSALTYTDPTLMAGATLIKAAHVQELRTGVK